MKKLLKLMAVATLTFGTFQLATAPDVQAEMKMGPGNFMKKGMHISSPWASPTSADDKSAAVFMTVMNHRRDDVVLTEIKTPAADKVMIHNVVTKDGKRIMEMAKNGLPLAKHQIVIMEPGGTHIMLMGLKEPLKEGAMIPMTLIFDKAGPIDIKVSIAKPETAPAAMKSMGDDKKTDMRGSHGGSHAGSHKGDGK